MNKKTEICGLCFKKIDTEKESYCEISDFIKGNFLSKAFYHSKCYNNRLNSEDDNLKQVTMDLAEQAKKMMSDMGYKQEKVYEIK